MANPPIFFFCVQRKSKGKDLLSSICQGLNIIEKDYFGLLYSTPVDPRVWLDLEKPVAKFFKTDPWILQFAVKFYPPEPAQLQEDITRYQLCLQVAKYLKFMEFRMMSNRWHIIYFFVFVFRSEMIYLRNVYHVHL